MAFKPAKILYRKTAFFAKDFCPQTPLLVFPRGQFQTGFLKLTGYYLVILLQMRPYAAGAALYALLGERETAAALIS